jgi:phage shock protein A
MSSGSDVELELARMKAELSGGSAEATPAIEQGQQSATPQAPNIQDQPRFDK